MEEKFLDILEDICGDEVVREDLDINMVEEGLIDSLDFIELIVAIEDEAYVDNVLVVDGKDKVILQGKIKNVEIKTKGVEVIQDDKK